MSEQNPDTCEQTNPQIITLESTSDLDLESRPYWKDEFPNHNCGSPSWREKESDSFNFLLDFGLEGNESSFAVENLLRENNMFPDNTQKQESTQSSKKFLNVSQSRKNHSSAAAVTVRENSWLGLDEYKKQKLEMMYPKNFERETFLLKEVYRRLLLQKLQFTLGELEEYRRTRQIKLNKATTLASPISHKSVALSTINPSNQIYVPNNSAQVSSHDLVFQPFQQITKLKRRPVSASSIPTFGPNDVDSHNFLLSRRKTSFSNIEALDMEAKNKEVDCQNIYSFLSRTQDNSTSVHVPDSTTSSLLKTISSSSSNNLNLGPYKVSQFSTKPNKKQLVNSSKNGSVQTQHIARPFSGFKNIEPATLTVKQKLENHLRPDRKFVLSKKPVMKPYRFTSKLLNSNESFQLEPNPSFLKKAEVTDINVIRQSVVSQPFSE